MPASVIRNAVLALSALVIQEATASRNFIWLLTDPVNPINCDREIESFTTKQCWDYLRFRKGDLLGLMTSLRIPATLNLDNDTVFWGEYAFLLFLYRMHYPGTLWGMQEMFGRDYTSISRIHCRMVDWMHFHHVGKVVGNLEWYRTRFNDYNLAYNKFISESRHNLNPGTVPRQLSNLFGSIDGTHRPIGRLLGNGNAQHPFWNGYYHCHCLIFLTINFPDGMLVLEPVSPGYYTDLLCWNEAVILRNQLETLMNFREHQNSVRLKLYGDKILTAAFSRRHGPLFLWMTAHNSIMSGIRVTH
jgi:hypothetical protein